MMRALWILSALLWRPPATAAEPLPAHLTGTWATGASLYDGTEAQSEMYIPAEGIGIAAGSTPAARRVDGSDAGRPAPRAIIGIAFHTSLQGEVLVLQPFLPDPKERKPASANRVILCRHEAGTLILTCTGGEGVPIVMKRRSEEIPDQIKTMIGQIPATGSP